MEHRGEIVLKILTQRGINKTEMADKLNVKRQTLYNQLENPNMKTHYILKIGEVLNFDFAEVIPSLKRELKEMPTARAVEEEADVENDELDVTIHLDGTDETLKKIIEKLTRVNEALRFSV